MKWVNIRLLPLQRIKLEQQRERERESLNNREREEVKHYVKLEKFHPRINYSNCGHTYTENYILVILFF